MILCARSTSRSSEQSTKHRSRSLCENVIHSIGEITPRLYDYQTWPTHFLGNSRDAHVVRGLFFFIVLFGCWLAEQRNSGHMEVKSDWTLRSRSKDMTAIIAENNNWPTRKMWRFLCFCGVLCCGVLCRAAPCRAVPCRAVPCRAVPCRAVQLCARLLIAIIFHNQISTRLTF